MSHSVQKDSAAVKAAMARRYQRATPGADAPPAVRSSTVPSAAGGTTTSASIRQHPLPPQDHSRHDTVTATPLGSILPASYDNTRPSRQPQQLGKVATPSVPLNTAATTPMVALNYDGLAHRKAAEQARTMTLPVSGTTVPIQTTQSKFREFGDTRSVGHSTSERLNTARETTIASVKDETISQSSDIHAESASHTQQLNRAFQPAATTSSTRKTVLASDRTAAKNDFLSRQDTEITGNPGLPRSDPIRRQHAERANHDDNEPWETESERSEEEPEETVEETEPLAEENCIIDSACIANEELVILQSEATSRILEYSETGLPQFSGYNLQRSGQHISLSLISAVDNTLRYGSRIVLRCKQSEKRSNALALGVRNIEGTSKHQVGFFSSIVGKSEQWTVLRACTDGIVRVGSTAIAKEPRPRRTAAVRSGAPVVLRNLHTGGLLSLCESGTLCVLTDSYDANTIRNGSSADRSLIVRLHRNGLFLPSHTEIFHLVLSTVPPTPLWALGECKRSYLTTAYLDDNSRTGDIEKSPPHINEGIFFHHQDRIIQMVADEKKFIDGQEATLMKEVLGSFIGLEGNWVRASHNGSFVTFRLKEREGRIDATLSNLVMEMLPLASAYASIRRFVSETWPGNEYGRVMQAFREAVEEILEEYTSFISTIEDVLHSDVENFSIQKIYVLVRPAMHSMSVIRAATEKAKEKKGGALLNALRGLMLTKYGGDDVGSKVIHSLLDKASVPYFSMFQKWMEFGVLDDVHDEFMIRSRSDLSWEKRYSILDVHVLDGFFSAKTTVEQILAAGKYWNAIRKCDDIVAEELETVVSPQAPNLHYGMSMAKMSRHVESMYHKASTLLVQYLLNDQRLPFSLRTIKKYFLLDQGDFFVNFMDNAEDELLKPIEKVSHARIQQWLSLSIHQAENYGEEGLVFPSSQANYNKPTALVPVNLCCRFATSSLAHQLDTLHNGGIDTNEQWTPSRNTYGSTNDKVVTGLQTFMLECTVVPFPVSLVLSQRALEHYSLLFRHLFYAKHVERRMFGIWQDHQSMKEMQALRGIMGATFLLRQRMLHFLQNLIYYMMLEVIEPNWLEMENAIRSEAQSGTVDDILKIHNQFLERTLEACLLTNRDLIRALTKLMTTCLRFAEQMKRFMHATRIERDRQNFATERRNAVQRNLNDRGSLVRNGVSQQVMQESLKKDREDRQRRVSEQTVRVQREVLGESYQRMLTRFDEVFSQNLRDFMILLSRSDDLFYSQKVNLCIRLDYNGYVSQSIGLTSRSGAT